MSMASMAGGKRMLRRQLTKSRIQRIQSINLSFREEAQAIKEKIKNDELIGASGKSEDSAAMLDIMSHRPLMEDRRASRLTQASIVSQEIRIRKRLKRMPRWMRLAKKIYHQYGLKHLLLLSILLVYQFAGAAVFYWIESTHEENKELQWLKEIQANRTVFIRRLIPGMFNNSDYLLFLSAEQTYEMYSMLDTSLDKYETQLNIKYSDQKIKWDFWNAMLYAGTICTTIGYGHLYPTTVAGRLLTMIYAIFGIPLVLSILDDLGKLLTKCMKYPWMLLKMACRRAFRYCTKQSWEEIHRVDDEDRAGLAIFDLPIPVALFIVVAWIFVCSATFCIWEEDWDYFLAFYFFFISLSTIGLGDIVPAKPKYLLMLYGYIIIGLSLVSMCVNLIQAKLEQSYEAGRDDLSQLEAIQSGQSPALRRRPSRQRRNRSRGAVDLVERPRDSKDSGSKASKRGSTGGSRGAERSGSAAGGASLGVFKTHSSYSISSQKGDGTAKDSPREPPKPPRKASRMSQTLLSFPSPLERHSKSAFRQLFHPANRSRVIPTTFSVDDVMRLVDTEEDDVIILHELSEQCYTGNNANLRQVTASIEHEPRGPRTAFEQDAASLAGLLAQAPSDLDDIEELEELEDKILLGGTKLSPDRDADRPGPSAAITPRLPRRSRVEPQASPSQPQVQFRSRISVVGGGESGSSTSHSASASQLSSLSGARTLPRLPATSSLNRLSQSAVSGGGTRTTSLDSFSRSLSTPSPRGDSARPPRVGRREEAREAGEGTSSRRVLSSEAVLEEDEEDSAAADLPAAANARSRSYYKIS